MSTSTQTIEERRAAYELAGALAKARDRNAQLAELVRLLPPPPRRPSWAGPSPWTPELLALYYEVKGE